MSRKRKKKPRQPAVTAAAPAATPAPEPMPTPPPLVSDAEFGLAYKAALLAAAKRGDYKAVERLEALSVAAAPRPAVEAPTSQAPKRLPDRPSKEWSPRDWAFVNAYLTPVEGKSVTAVEAMRAIRPDIKNHAQEAWKTRNKPHVDAYIKDFRSLEMESLGLTRAYIARRQLSIADRAVAEAERQGALPEGSPVPAMELERKTVKDLGEFAGLASPGALDVRVIPVEEERKAAEEKLRLSFARALPAGEERDDDAQCQ